MLGELAQVLAGAEATPGTGDHDGANGGISGLLERRPQRGVQRPVERVEDVRPVERDREDGAVAAVSTSLMARAYRGPRATRRTRAAV